MWLLNPNDICRYDERDQHAGGGDRGTNEQSDGTGQNNNNGPAGIQ